MKSLILSFITLSFILSCQNQKKSTTPQEESVYKLSLAQWSFNKSFKSGDVSPYEFAKMASELGFEGLEYVSQLYTDVMESEDKPVAIQAFVDKNNALAAQYKIKNVLIMVDDEGDLSTSDENSRLKAIENHKLWIQAAHKMGCSAIRLNLHGEDDVTLWTTNSITSLQTLSEFAKPLNVNIIVENHGGNSSNASLLMNVINQVKFDNCGTLPDFGNFCLSKDWGSLKDNKCNNPYDPYLGVSEMMPKAFGVSAKAYDFDTDGNETILDYQKLLSIVKKSGYKGFIGVEYEGDHLSEEEGIIATRKLIEKTVSNL
jgi:sugar phosphate isomerase/epimerase